MAFQEKSRTKYQVSYGDKPFKCRICGKKYAIENFMKVHMRVHEAKKIYKCSVCRRSFPFDCKLKKHMMIHTDTLQYSCKICGKIFICNRSLKKHSKIHSKKELSHCVEKPTNHGKSSTSGQIYTSKENKVPETVIGHTVVIGAIHDSIPVCVKKGTADSAIDGKYVKAEEVDCILKEEVYIKEEMEEYSTNVRESTETLRQDLKELKDIKKESSLVGEVSGHVRNVHSETLRQDLKELKDVKKESSLVGEVSGHVRNVHSEILRQDLKELKDIKKDSSLVGEVSGHVRNVHSETLRQDLKELKDIKKDSSLVDEISGHVRNVHLETLRQDLKELKYVKKESSLVGEASSQVRNVHSEPSYYSELIIVDELVADDIYESDIDPLA